jgi:predicted RNA-binding Zn-ribbon protein involved in translation (DUF1610 family)
MLTMRMENTIIKCTNKECLTIFSVIGYGYEDPSCTIINSGKLVPLTGNTPYFCPACGTNLGYRKEK